MLLGYMLGNHSFIMYNCLQAVYDNAQSIHDDVGRMIEMAFIKYDHDPSLNDRLHRGMNESWACFQGRSLRFFADHFSRPHQMDLPTVKESLMVPPNSEIDSRCLHVDRLSQPKKGHQ